MKLAITGKGGTGKTTIAGLLAHRFTQDGYQVLAVDADPDANLAFALGISGQQAASLIPIAKQRQLIKERTGANPRQFGQLFKINPVVNDIPDRFLIKSKGIKLLVMGGVQKGGDGCACPENVLLRSLLSEIVLNRKEIVIVDMEAGVEHLGRSTAQAINMMIIVVEPGSRSIETARLIMKLAKEIGIESFGIIGNKIQNEQQKVWLNTQFPRDQILGLISYHGIIRDADLEQRSLIDISNKKLSKEMDKIYQEIKLKI